jgi:5-methylcytosine-specific restriction protein A
MAATEAKEKLLHLGALIRLRLPEHKSAEFRFDHKAIDLDSPAASSRSGYYEAAHAFGTTYLLPLPPEDELTADLHRMVRLYRLLTFRGGTTEEPDGEYGFGDETSLSTSGLEDARRYRLHRRIERNGSLAEAAKRVHGLTCQACGFNFERFYGAIGRGYIEAHHLTPLASLPKDGPIQLDAKEDFSVLCANCHRMIHRKEAPQEIGAFRLLFQDQRSGSAARQESAIEVPAGNKTALKKLAPPSRRTTEQGDA